jgi:hypothetical protein
MDYDEGLEESAYSEGRVPKTARRLLVGANYIVRMLFKKKVNSHRKHGLKIQTADTARIIADFINRSEDINELSEFYHRARYGDEVITNADAARLKKRRQ